MLQYPIVKIRPAVQEILTRLSGGKDTCGTTVHAQENIAPRKTFRNRLSVNKLNHLSLFTSETYMFHPAKAKLSGGERRSFGRQKTVFCNPKHICLGMKGE